jgi:hypothetical protein
MGFASNLEKLDEKDIALCDYCQILLTDYYRDQGLLPSLDDSVEPQGPQTPMLAAGNSPKPRP